MMQNTSVLDSGATKDGMINVEAVCLTFDEIYTQFAPLVSYILKKKFYDNEVVHDLIQDIFVKVYENPSVYKISEKDALKRIICKITSCTIVDYYRREALCTKRTNNLIHNITADELIHSGSIELSMPHYKELKKEAYHELKRKRGSKIAKRTVRIIALRCLGYTQRECAEKLNVSRSIIQIDLDNLRKIVARLFPEYQVLRK